MGRLISVLFAIFFAGCGSQPTTLTFSGETWGTTYNIVVVDRSAALDRGSIDASIKSVLADVDRKLSNWDSRSEISRFNAALTTDPVSISEDLAEVIAISNDVHQQSHGRFDLTLGPLIDLWGFGAREPGTPIPSDEAIEAALSQVGQLDVLKLDRAAGTLQKTRSNTNVYLAALAKGYGIDEIARELRRLGITDYLVEVGGDLVTSGINPKGEAWRIGIEVPDSLPGAVQEIVELSGMGMATSGDYRNYFEVDGRRYSHILDSETGRPITHKTASVTVLAENATLADAWATALLVLGENSGLEIAENLGIAAYFIVRDTSSSETGYRIVTSERFEQLQSSW
ncbi:MAG: FAD:protein FMN transferase [Pseudomonadota bacterium]